LLSSSSMGRKLAYAILLLFFLFWVSGCGYYSFSGSSLPGIKTVAVPLFDNQTEEYGIRESLTETIANRFVTDNTLKVVNEKIADSILHGSITKYLREAYTFDEQENIKEYIVRIWVNVWFEEKKSKKTIWKEDNIEGWGIYCFTNCVDQNGNPKSEETEDDGKQRAIEKLAEEITNRTVKGW
jgi:hypothetical protein